MTVDLALYQPDIAQNTGTLLRLAACVGIRVHIIHPTGFTFGRRQLKHGALDYLDDAEIMEHDSYDFFAAWRRNAKQRMVLLSTKAGLSAYQCAFGADDVLVFGRESAGVPPHVAADADIALRIPMRPDRRSLNVAVAASMVLGEALRQTGHFEALS